MSLFLMMLAMLITLVSTCAMSYLAVSIEITFWVAPIITLLLVLLGTTVAGRKIYGDNLVLLLAAGTVGEMIGLSIGFSWPTLYFLHKQVFLSWMQYPVRFASMIGLLTIATGALASVIAYWLRLYLIENPSLPFPTAGIVYNLIYQTNKTDTCLIKKGVIVSTIWSMIAVFLGKRLQGFWLLQVHTIPTLLSMGFVAGHMVAKPLLIGMITRFLVLFGLPKIYYSQMKSEDFVLTFALGMLLAVVCKSFYFVIKNLYAWICVQNWKSDFSFVNDYRRNHYDWILSVMAILLYGIVLHHWHISVAQQWYMIIALSVACCIISLVFAQMGVLDLPSFGSFVVIPLGYLFYISQESLLIAFILATICLGLVIVLLFSWKIADLANIQLNQIITYQAAGFLLAAVSVGFMIWWYATVLNFDTETLFSSQALLQEKFITLKLYDAKIFILGFLGAIGLYFVTEEMSLVITGCMMDFSIVVWLVLAGGMSFYVKNSKKYYPFCFGVYVSHALWLFVQAVFL